MKSSDPTFVAQRIGQSRFWNTVWKEYIAAPSLAFCRTAELEYVSTLDVNCQVLDHCCGDGFIASVAWSGQFISAGFDMNAQAVAKARSHNIYKRLDVCDASTRLPYADATFDLVFNNSALEHIENIDSTLAEIARVLKPGGIFAVTIFNHRFFEWWPLDEKSKVEYKKWQPVFHAPSLEQLSQYFEYAGLQTASVQGYFDRKAAQVLAYIDYEFSGMYLSNRRSLFAYSYLRFPLLRKFWRWRLSLFSWRTEPDAGAGYFIQAIRP